MLQKQELHILTASITSTVINIVHQRKERNLSIALTAEISTLLKPGSTNCK